MYHSRKIFHPNAILRKHIIHNAQKNEAPFIVPSRSHRDEER